MAAGIGLQLAVNNYTLNICKALTSCKVPKDVEEVLRKLLLLVRPSTDHTQVDSTSTNPTPDSSYARLLHEAQSTQYAAHVMQALLFQQMESITFSLLPGARRKLCCSSCLMCHMHPIYLLASETHLMHKKAADPV